MARFLHEKAAEVNAQGVEFDNIDNASQAPAISNHEPFVQLLLYKGAKAADQSKGAVVGQVHYHHHHQHRAENDGPSDTR
ncbi:MAG: hypothetical protein M1826_003408 [Phylliscum demangeonii]|nr:MAG: hypothetical protein M1826_003408 [Phylliscum demangeonii]